MEKSPMTFLLLFNDLKFGKGSLFCCNGYRHAIFKIIFYESQEEYLRKEFTKEKERKNANDFFYCYLIHFYDLNYLNSTKSRLSNQKSGMVPEINFDSKMDIVTKFQVFIFKNYEVRGGGKKPPPP